MSAGGSHTGLALSALPSARLAVVADVISDGGVAGGQLRVLPGGDGRLWALSSFGLSTHLCSVYPQREPSSHLIFKSNGFPT